MNKDVYKMSCHIKQKKNYAYPNLFHFQNLEYAIRHWQEKYTIDLESRELAIEKLKSQRATHLTELEEMQILVRITINLNTFVSNKVELIIACKSTFLLG